MRNPKVRDEYTANMSFLECGPMMACDGAGRSLFDGVHLSVDAETVVAVEGPSGGGKSTLLRQLVGLDRAPGARRVLDDEDFTGSARLPLWRSRVSLLPQGAPVLPGSVEYNLRFAYQLKNSGQREFPRDRARFLLDRVGLGEVGFDRAASELSGGEKHRLALVRGLLWDPPVLVADEPFAALDPDGARACFDLLVARARRPGRAAIVVLHQPELGNAADLRLRLETGKLEAR